MKNKLDGDHLSGNNEIIKEFLIPGPMNNKLTGKQGSFNSLNLRGKQDSMINNRSDTLIISNSPVVPCRSGYSQMINNPLIYNNDSDLNDEIEHKQTGLIRNMKDLERRVLSLEDVTKLEKINPFDEPESKDLQNFAKFQNKYLEDIKEKIDEELEADLTEKEVVLIVAIKLPFNIRLNSDGKYSLSKTYSLIYSKIYDRDEGNAKHEEWWVGWGGWFPKDEEEKKSLEDLYREHKCIPIWFEAQVIEEFYNFCEFQVMPLFHNFKTHLEHKESYDEFDDWEWYKCVNKEFSEKIFTIISTDVQPRGKNALVWINNQHLILTPMYLRAKIPDVSWGLYLHCPFPASEMFKLIPYRKSLLKSLLNCDCIGFHSFEYARNFFTTCKRLLSVNFEFRRTGQIGIDYHGRNVSLVISHVGVSYDSILKQLSEPKLQKYIKHTKTSKRKIFSSVDSLSHIAGIREKFLAFQQFLRSDPSHAKTWKLIQYLEPLAANQLYLSNTYKDQAMKIRGEIVKEFGSHVISVRFETLDERKRLLLWARTNVLLNTTLRGGLRLPSLEYIAVREILGKESKSIIILSEFSGGIRVLSGVLKCNPYSIKETAIIIERAYNFSPKGQEK